MAKSRQRAPTLIQQSRRLSSADKAQWHELGGTRGVQREFFGLNATDEAALAKRISDGLDQQLKE